MARPTSTTDLQVLKKRRRIDSTKGQAHKKAKRVEFQSFKNRLSDISIKSASYSFDGTVSSANLDDSSVLSTLKRIHSINISEDFDAYYNEIVTLTESLPILLHNLDEFVDITSRHLIKRPSMATGAILEIVSALAKDTREMLVPHFGQLFSSLTEDLLLKELGNADLIENIYQCLGYLFKFLGKYLSLQTSFDLFHGLLHHKRHFIRQFAAEALSILVLRNACSPGGLESTVQLVLGLLQPEDDIILDSVAAVFFETIKSKLEGAFHSIALPVLSHLLDSAPEELLTALFVKLRVHCSLSDYLTTFGDLVIEKFARPGVLSLITSTLLPSHRPKKQDEQTVLDSFVTNLLETIDDTVPVSLLARLWAVSSQVTANLYFGRVTWWVDPVKTADLLFTLGEDSADLPGVESAVQSLLSNGDITPDVAACLANSGAQLTLSTEQTDAIASLAVSSEQSLPYWQLLEGCSSAVALEYLRSVEPSCPLVTCAAIRSFSTGLPADITLWVLKTHGHVSIVVEALADTKAELCDEGKAEAMNKLKVAKDRLLRVNLLRLLQADDDMISLESCTVTLDAERERKALCSRAPADEVGVAVLLAQFRVPLSTIWDAASDALINLSQSVPDLVWMSLQERIVSVSVDVTGASTDHPCDDDSVLTRYMSSQSALLTPERSTDAATESRLLWNLATKLVTPERELWILDYVMRSCLLVNDHPPAVVSAALNAVAVLFSESVLQVTDAVKESRLNLVSFCFDNLLSCPDPALSSPALQIVCNAEAYRSSLLPVYKQLADLCGATCGPGFRDALLKFPVDSTTDTTALMVVFRVLFGKLSRKAKGMDQRGNLHQRRAMIMGYLGTVEPENIWMILDVCLTPMFSAPLPNWQSIDNVKWSDDVLSFTSGSVVLVKGTRARRLAVLESLAILIKQVRMKLVSHVKVIGLVLASILVQSADDPLGLKLSLKTLADWMQVFPSECDWSAILSPAMPHIIAALNRSSSNEVSAAMRLVGIMLQQTALHSVLHTHSDILPTYFSLPDYSGAAALAIYTALIAFLKGDRVLKKSGRADYASAWLERRKRWKDKREEQDVLEEDDAEADAEAERQAKADAANIALLAPHLGKVLESMELAINGRCQGPKLVIKMLPLEVDLLSQLSSTLRLCPAPAVVGKLVELLLGSLPTAAKKHKGSGAVPILRAICALVPTIPAVSPTSLELIAPMFTSIQDLIARKELAAAALAIAERLGDTSAADRLVSLNSLLSGVATVQPDYDLHVKIFAEVEEDTDALVNDKACLLLRHALFVLGVAESDFGVRHCAERLITVSLIKCEESFATRALQGIVMPHLRKLLLSAEESVQRSALKVLSALLRDYVSNLADDSIKLSMHCDLLQLTGVVTNGATDEGGDVLEDLQHMQKHRRARAFNKLADAAVSGTLSIGTICSIVVPLAFHGLLQRGASKQNYDPNLGDNACRALTSAVGSEPFRMFKLIIQEFLPRYPERERVLLKTLSVLTASFAAIATADDRSKLKKQVRSLVDQLRVLVSSDVSKRLKKKQEEQEEVKETKAHKKNAQMLVRVDVVSALLSLFKVYPEDEASAVEAETERLTLQVIQGLAAREVDIRNDARRALIQCACASGSARLPWLLKQIRHRLFKGGYQTPVAVFSAHAVLVAAVSAGLVLPTEITTEALALLKLEDERWWSVQARDTVNEGINNESAGEVLPNQVMEAKHPKGHAVLEIVSQYLPDSKMALTALFQVIYDQSFDIDTSTSLTPFLLSASAAQGQRFARRVEEALRHVVVGFMRNADAADNTKLFGFCLPLLSCGASLLTRGISPSSLFDPDSTLIDVEEEKAEVAFVNAKRDSHFAVQPGAATGRSAHASEEWKRKGKRSDASVKARMLCLLGLRELFKMSRSPEFLSADPSVLCEVATNVGHCFCSGQDELFVAAAKCMQKILLRKGSTVEMEEKQGKRIVKTILSSLQHQSGMGADSLSIRTIMHRKSKALSHPAEVATTCTKLLVALLLTQKKKGQKQLLIDEDLTNKDGSPSELAEALVSHVAISLDRKALQGSALMLLRRVIIRKKLKLSSVYDCAEKVSELLVTATIPAVAALAGSIYASFLTDYEHTESSMVKRLSFLLKHLSTGQSPETRRNFANCLHAFVSTVNVKLLQESYAALILLPAAAQVAMERDDMCKQMLDSLVQTVLTRVDVNVRKQLSEIITRWPQVSPKWQLHLASIELRSRIACLTTKDTMADAERLLFSEDLFASCPADARSVAIVSCLKAMDALFQSGVSPADSLIDSMVSKMLDCEDPVILPQAWQSIPALVSSKPTYPWGRSGVLAKGLRLLDATGIAAEKDYKLLQGVIKAIAAVSPYCSSGEDDTGEVADDMAEPVAEIVDESQSYEDEELADSIDDVSVPVEEEEDEVVTALIDNKEFGLFSTTAAKAEDNEQLTRSKSDVKYTCWLLTRLSYIVRNLLKSPSCSVLRLAAIIKLSMAIISPMLSCADLSSMLRPIISTLVRLSTIRLFFREVAEEGEVQLDVTTLGGLASLPTNRQLSTVVRLAEEALRSLEADCKSCGVSDVYNTILISVRSAIQKTRSQRKVDKKQMAVLDPSAFAAQKIKRNEVKKARAKIKRVDFIQNKRRMIK